MNFFHTSTVKGQDGITLQIKVVPRSSKLGPLGIIDGHLKWGVSAAPVDGEANKALIASIAKQLAVAKSLVQIISGEKSKLKVIFIEGLATEQILKTLINVDKLHD